MLWIQYSFLFFILFGTIGKLNTDQACGLQARGGGVDSPHPGHGLVVVDEPLATDGHLRSVGDQVLLTGDMMEQREVNMESSTDPRRS